MVTALEGMFSPRLTFGVPGSTYVQLVSTVIPPVTGRLAVIWATDNADVQHALAAVPAAATPDAVLRLVARATRRGNEPSLRRSVIIDTGTDPTSAAFWITMKASRRAADAHRAVLTPAAVRLRDTFSLRPGMSVEHAVDILVFFFSADSWRRLVIDSDWTWDEAEQWLIERATCSLLFD